MEAYAFDQEEDLLTQLLELNLLVAQREAAGERVTAPGAIPTKVTPSTWAWPQGPGKVVFQRVRSSSTGLCGSRAWCGVAAAMFVAPARRRTLIAVERRIAMTRGPWPVRTAERSSS